MHAESGDDSPSLAAHHDGDSGTTEFGDSYEVYPSVLVACMLLLAGVGVLGLGVYLEVIYYPQEVIAPGARVLRVNTLWLLLIGGVFAVGGFCNLVPRRPNLIVTDRGLSSPTEDLELTWEQICDIRMVFKAGGDFDIVAVSVYGFREFMETHRLQKRQAQLSRHLDTAELPIVILGTYHDRNQLIRALNHFSDGTLRIPEITDMEA